MEYSVPCWCYFLTNYHTSLMHRSCSWGVLITFPKLQTLGDVAALTGCENHQAAVLMEMIKETPCIAYT